MDELEIGRLASDLRLVVGQLVRRARQEAGIMALAQLTALGFLDRDGATTVSELAAVAHVRPQSMARTVADLGEAGLVVAHPHPSDGRKTLIELTQDGRVALAGERHRRAGWLAEGIAQELSPAEQRTLAEATQLMARLARR